MLAGLLERRGSFPHSYVRASALKPQRGKGIERERGFKKALAAVAEIRQNDEEVKDMCVRFPYLDILFTGAVCSSASVCRRRRSYCMHRQKSKYVASSRLGLCRHVTLLQARHIRRCMTKFRNLEKGQELEYQILANLIPSESGRGKRRLLLDKRGAGKERRRVLIPSQGSIQACLI